MFTSICIEGSIKYKNKNTDNTFINKHCINVHRFNKIFVSEMYSNSIISKYLSLVVYDKSKSTSFVGHGTTCLPMTHNSNPIPNNVIFVLFIYYYSMY